MRIPKRKSCKSVSIDAFLEARILPNFLTLNSLC